MARNPKKPSKAARTLDDKVFAAIMAVEGLALSTTAKKRQSVMNKKNLTPAQKRAEVLRAYKAR